MEKIKAPFTEEQVERLNNYQHGGGFHPFTGCGQMKEVNNKYRGKVMEGDRSLCLDGYCLLIATTDGWICPCKKYTQDWAYKSMVEIVEK